MLILLSSVGMGMMVSAGDLLTLYVGLELQSLAAYVLAGFSAATTARPRPASNISCSARSPRASCSTASRCSTASPARPLFAGDRRQALATASRPASCSASSSSSPASPSRSAPCRSTCGRPTSTKARRPRSPPSSPRRPRSRRWRCWSASASRRWARRLRMAADRHLHGARLDHPRRRRRDRPDQHQAPARLFLDQQCRLRADRARRRQPEAASPRCCSTWRSMS